MNRRDFLQSGSRGLGLLGLGGLVGLLAGRGSKRLTVWQIDPGKCIHCDRCATECVLETSAVKCVHAFSMCGYCKLCTGYFEPEPNALDTGAENQLCPTGAIRRRFVEDPYYEYTIEEALCVGCAKCVKGCTTFGNGSLFLQVRHDRCLNCNDCSIAAVCPAGAFRRVPADHPYLLKGRETDDAV
ncbi:MAG: ferredoxin [Planctomycetes bacterium]|nr:ferredoxin [Planctomycetota bacterium]